MDEQPEESLLGTRLCSRCKHFRDHRNGAHQKRLPTISPGRSLGRSREQLARQTVQSDLANAVREENHQLDRPKVSRSMHAQRQARK